MHESCRCRSAQLTEKVETRMTQPKASGGLELHGYIEHGSNDIIVLRVDRKLEVSAELVIHISEPRNIVFRKFSRGHRSHVVAPEQAADGMVVD